MEYSKCGVKEIFTCVISNVVFGYALTAILTMDTCLVLIWSEMSQDRFEERTTRVGVEAKYCTCVCSRGLMRWYGGWNSRRECVSELLFDRSIGPSICDPVDVFWCRTVVMLEGGFTM